MAVADRARKRMPQQGDYLDKDDLIREQEPFGVATCVYDERGSNFGPRWVLSLIPWFEDQEAPKGLLTFTANPTRNPFFEDLQAQIEENDNEPIGPLVVIKGKSTKGFRYYTLDDWKEDAPVAAPSPAPARPARPTAPASQQEAAVVVPPESIPANGEPAKRKPGRPRKTSPTSSTTVSLSTSTSAPTATGESKPAATAIAPEVQEVKPANVGSVVCPDCKQVVEGRILPDDSGRRFIIHPFCPTLNKATVVEVMEA